MLILFLTNFFIESLQFVTSCSFSFVVFPKEMDFANSDLIYNTTALSLRNV